MMMNRTFRLTRTYLIVAIVFVSFGLAIAATGVTVKVKKTSLRKDKQFFAPTISEARYGERLELIKQDKDWRFVSFKGKKGWVHQTAIATGGGAASLSTRSSKNPKMAATSDEVALAGKGFNAQVESEYKKDKSKSDYNGVDRMEKVAVSGLELLRFVKEGGLAEKPNE